MIRSVEQLDALLGAMPAAVGMKVIDTLDDGALRWLAASPLAFVAAAQDGGVGVTIAGGEPGFVRAPSPERLLLPLESLDEPSLLHAGRGVGTLFLVPGVGETLRVNGRVTEVTPAGIELAVDEVYVHCAKSLIRSGFWSAARRSDASLEPADFAREARFVALATANTDGDADLSPKGDAAGDMLRLSGAGLSYAERLGNRRKDSLRNLVAQPRAALIALIPGSSVVGLASGEVSLNDDRATCAQFAVEGRTPRLVTQLRGSPLVVRESGALSRVAPWPVRETDHGLDPSAILTAHVKLSKTAGLGAGLMRKLISKQVMSFGLRHDYKHKLY